MDYNISIENFDGPFDLLLHLVVKNKMEIYDIPINQLTEEYLLYIEEFKSEIKEDREIKLASISEFIYIASRLIYIKSKMLLPRKEEEPDPREELVDKIKEYQLFKEISKQFEEISFEMYTRNPEESVFLAIKDYEQISIDDVLKDVSLTDLYKAFKGVMLRASNKVDKVRSEFKKVNRPTFNIDERKDYILDLLYLKERLSFDTIFDEDASKIEVVVTFLAMLDLIRYGKIFVTQDKNFEQILLNRTVEV
ncbi:MAG: segregation and condensation protein A [Lachnospirales bacterium]